MPATDLNQWLQCLDQGGHYPPLRGCCRVLFAIFPVLRGDDQGFDVEGIDAAGAEEMARLQNALWAERRAERIKVLASIGASV